MKMGSSSGGSLKGRFILSWGGPSSPRESESAGLSSEGMYLKSKVMKFGQRTEYVRWIERLMCEFGLRPLVMEPIVPWLSE